MMDEIDLALLSILQKQGRMKRNELAEKVGLTTPAVSERMRKMQEKGVIKNYAAIVDPLALQLDMGAFIFVTSESSQYYGEIITHADSEPEILECHAITGDGSHILKVRTKNTAALERLLARIQSWKGVIRTRTNIILSSYKESSALPLNHLKNMQEDK